MLRTDTRTGGRTDEQRKNSIPHHKVCGAGLCVCGGGWGGGEGRVYNDNASKNRQSITFQNTCWYTSIVCKFSTCVKGDVY